MVIKLMAKVTFAAYIEHCCSIVDMIVIISAPHHTAGSVKKRWDNNALAAVYQRGNLVECSVHLIYEGKGIYYFRRL